jgi:hypothetical protein
MSAPDLIIAGVVIPRLEGYNIGQTYEEISPSSLLRLGDGTGMPQSNDWVKLSTRIRAAGLMPPGLAGVYWRDPAGIVIACKSARSIKSTTHVVTLPTARRLDVAPLGYAIVNGFPVETTIDIVDGIATLGVLVGATAYRVHYYPLLTVFTKGPVENNDDDRASWDWSLEGEQL